MNIIELKNTLPNVFLSRDDIHSEIWNNVLKFEKGKLYLVEAASGTGKSSLCSFIYGYRFDYQGAITFDGQATRNYSVGQWVNIRRRTLGLLWQELRLFPELTALENIQIKNKLTHYVDEEKIRRWFDQLGIGDKLSAKVGLMSFGQQQRVAFIRSLCQPCDFLFLDEPISHLDDENGAIMGEMIKEEALGHQGAGVIVTSIGKHIPLNYDRSFKL